MVTCANAPLLLMPGRLQVTNYHVIRGAQNIQVTLANQSIVKATVVGGDMDKDVAVLQMDKEAIKV